VYVPRYFDSPDRQHPLRAVDQVERDADLGRRSAAARGRRALHGRALEPLAGGESLTQAACDQQRG